MTRFQDGGGQKLLTDRSRGALAKYRDAVVGDVGWLRFLWFELVTTLFQPAPGALGLLLRRLAYPSLFHSCGRGVIFGRNISLRHPHRIRLGDHAVLSDDCTLDAKGREGEGILVGDGVFIGKGAMVSMIDGTIELAEGASVGAYCRIGTYGHTRIGRKALLAAFVYVIGAGHRTERLDVPIADQPNTTRGGATVGDGCWIGAKATVMDGVRIGRDCIVGAHALVAEDLPDFAVAAGIPARVLRLRTEGAAEAAQG